ncbi:hypothetical protein [Novilysobacter selenitireducens]|uniref:Tyr recombinase domain-containing protein n=1 Tax=Novilysobacter selenitireducens TaxID=2872639 RepID=A0ABS7T565_9GAMM|nr:hypothetical protein [Lysobacter selenitireducens]MBZ4039020.1 hypothetical protein [Lysobacter selenitireducens]
MSAFIDDHCAMAVAGRLRMRMAEAILEGLHLAGHNARIECVAPATTNWRLNMLHKAHRALHLPFDDERLRRRRPEIYAAWEAERAAIGLPMAVPMTVTRTVEALLNACEEDRNGIQDKSLIVVLCRLSASQVTQLRFNDLVPGVIMEDGKQCDVVDLTIRRPFGRLQTFQPRIRFVGRDATLLMAWGSIRGEQLLPGARDHFFLRETRRNASPELTQVWIGRRIRHLAQVAGLAKPNGRNHVSPQWLRKSYEREWREDFLLTKVARAARVSTSTAFRLTRPRDAS